MSFNFPELIRLIWLIQITRSLVHIIIEYILLYLFSRMKTYWVKWKSRPFIVLLFQYCYFLHVEKAFHFIPLLCEFWIQFEDNCVTIATHRCHGFVCYSSYIFLSWNNNKFEMNTLNIKAHIEFIHLHIDWL